MSDYILVTKGVRLDPKRVSKDIEQLRLKVSETIAEAVRLKISEFLRQLRKAHSKRMSQLQKYMDDPMAVARDNPFAGAQARKRKSGNSWIVFVTRGSQDGAANIKGGLFNLLDKGVQPQSGEMRAFPLFRPETRLRQRTLDPRSPVKLQTRRLKSGKIVPKWARTPNIAGFKGYKFYNTAVALVEKELVGAVVKQGELQYTITKADFKSYLVFNEVEVDG